MRKREELWGRDCRLGPKAAHALCNINNRLENYDYRKKGDERREDFVKKKSPVVKRQQVTTATSLLRIKLAATKKFKQRSSTSDVRKEVHSL